MNKTSRKISRRECVKLGLGLGALLCVRPDARAASELPAAGRTAGPGGILKVVKKAKPDLVVSTASTSQDELVCQIPYPFQVAPGLAGAFINLRLGFAGSSDYEAGGDVVLFDRLDRIGARPAIPVTRNRRENNPNDGGKPATMVKYPVSGGFVPLGAKRADGSPHPHAGTGFAINQSNARPPDGDPDPYYGKDPNRSIQFHEVHQLAYDGKTFRVVETQTTLKSRPLLPGWFISHPGLCNAIPDGDDLLMPMAGNKATGSLRPGSPDEYDNTLNLNGCGVVRWRKVGPRWQPISYSPVTPHDVDAKWMEPSIAREVDGSLQVCARNLRTDSNLNFAAATHESYQNDICIWKSADGSGAGSWTQSIHERLIRSGPLSLNRAADGTPYVASCLFEQNIYEIDAKFEKPWWRDTQSRRVHTGWMRERLYMWPLNAERTGVRAPIPVRCCRDDFGTPPGGTAWVSDHPISATVQLADGKWHGLIAYRVLESGERDNALPRAPQSGSYIEEVISRGPPIPVWNF